MKWPWKRAKQSEQPECLKSPDGYHEWINRFSNFRDEPLNETKYAKRYVRAWYEQCPWCGKERIYRGNFLQRPFDYWVWKESHP